MGAVAISYGIAAAFALALACCGRHASAKVLAAYLFSTWLLSNVIFRALSIESTAIAFALMDFVGCTVATLVWLRLQHIWLGLIVAAATSQSVLHIVFLPGPETHERAWHYILVNNALFAAQLVLVAWPTVHDLVRPARRRRDRGSPLLRLVSDTARAGPQLSGRPPGPSKAILRLQGVSPLAQQSHDAGGRSRTGAARRRAS